jgi:hypothetical protein
MHTFTRTLGILALLPVLGPRPALAETAYQRALQAAAATKAPDGRIMLDVENLIIGCSGDPGVQDRVAKTYQPPGHHDHDPDQWVSLDSDPEMKADLKIGVEILERVVRSISGTVYIEHFNDRPSGETHRTYAGALVRKLYRLMRPGARIVMDFHPIVEYVPPSEYEIEVHYQDCDHNPPAASVHTPTNPRNNPFWARASYDHFAQAVAPGSDFDTFGGRVDVMRLFSRAYRNVDPQPVPEPGEDLVRETRLSNERILAGAKAMLDNGIAKAHAPTL